VAWHSGNAFHLINEVTLRRARLVLLMGDCLRAGKPSRYITNAKVNSAFHPSGVGKSSTSLSGWGIKAGRVHLCRVAGNTVWSHMAGDAP